MPHVTRHGYNDQEHPLWALLLVSGLPYSQLRLQSTPGPSPVFVAGRWRVWVCRGTPCVNASDSWYLERLALLQCRNQYRGGVYNTRHMAASLMTCHRHLTFTTWPITTNVSQLVALTWNPPPEKCYTRMTQCRPIRLDLVYLWSLLLRLALATPGLPISNATFNRHISPQIRSYNQMQ